MAMRILGLLCTAFLVSLCGCARSPEAEAPRPNLLLVVVDTLRSDHLPSYGYGARQTTPNLTYRQEAGDLTSFEGLLATSSWTKPSMATLFTGLEPADHGVMRLVGPGSRLQDPHTLAQVLSEAGYRTGCVMSNFLLTRRTKAGFDHGFDTYLDGPGSRPDPHRGSTAEDVARLGMEWLQTVDEGQPWFLVLHFFDPHASFEDHPEVDWAPKGYQGWVTGGASTDLLREHEKDCSPADQAMLAAYYDEEIHAVDRAVGRVFSYLETVGEWDRTLMVFTADHGEELGERGHIGHTQTLFPELVDLPLLVHEPVHAPAPWSLPQAEGGGYRMAQLYPAMLHALGQPLPPGRTLEAPKYLTTQVDFEPIRREHVEKYVQKRAVRIGPLMLIEDQLRGEIQFFDRDEDYLMVHPLPAEDPRAKELHQRMSSHRWWEAP